MASDRHEIEFIAACDSDDQPTELWLRRNYGDGVRLSIADRPLGLGALFNRVETDADIVMCMGDDGYPATPFWNEIIARYVDGSPAGHPVAFAWHDLANPGQPTIICASPRWRDLTHPMLDERFPFWWADTAAAEVYAFVTGQHMPVLPIVMANRPRLNKGLRDMDFWWDFYVATRAERLAKAGEIRRTLGLPAPDDLQGIIRLFEERDERGRAAQFPASTTPPSSRYLVAKANAQAWMTERLAA